MGQIGCSKSLETKATALAFAGQHIANILQDGGTAPSTYTIQGQEYTVVTPSMTGGAGDQASALNSAISGAPAYSLIIIPPSPLAYSIGSSIDLPSDRQNMYLMGYNASLYMSDINGCSLRNKASNQGLFGITTWTDPSTWSQWLYDFMINPDKSVIPGKSYEVADRSLFELEELTSNVIVKDNVGSGSRGAVRMSHLNEVLIEGNKFSNLGSDGIHVTKKSRQVTVRYNSVMNGADDLISIVGYDTGNTDPVPNDEPPTGILVERNHVSYGRARGLSVHAGHEIIHRYNKVQYTLRCGLYYSCNDYSGKPSHSVSDVTAEHTILETVNMSTRFDNANGWVCAQGHPGRSITNITIKDTVCIDYGYGQYRPGATFWRADGGPIDTPTITGTQVVTRS